MKNENKNSGRKKKQIDLTFAKRLTMLLDEIKEKKGIVQKDVAQVVGVSRQALGKWATGETVPDVLDLVKLSNYFGVSADYLLGLSDVPSLDTNIQAVCEFTGLSEKALNEIRDTNAYRFKGIEGNPYNYPIPEGVLLNEFLESPYIYNVISNLYHLHEESKNDFLFVSEFTEDNFLEDSAEADARFDRDNALIQKKQAIYDKCDLLALRIHRDIDKFIAEIDKRDNFKNCEDDML